MKNLLITGGCGFVGSNLAILFKQKYNNYNIVAFDNLKRRGSELNISRLKENNINFIHGDVRNKEDFEQIKDIDCIIEASAEPSVLSGIDSPNDYLINTNLLGTINCLNFAVKNKSDFVFLSTSRVYPIKQIENVNFIEEENRFSFSNKQTMVGVSSGGITEKFSLNGARSLYGATKLASELLIEEYREFYGIKTIINRCGVLTGPFQMGKVDQGVVVLWIAKHYFKNKLAYIGYGGEGKQVRDILHINDLFDLLDYQIHNIQNMNGEIFNVGGGKNISVSLKELTEFCQNITGNKIIIDKVKENRNADIRIYITDNSKVENELGWKPKINVEKIVTDIFYWIKDNEKNLKNILN